MIKSNHILVINFLGLLSLLYYTIFTVVNPGVLVASFFVYFLFSCLGITITFHRYLTHKSFSFKWKWMERLFILFGSLAATGSAVGWVAVHKHHHAHSDTDHDVHGPSTGWKNFIVDYDDKIKYQTVKHLLKDRYIRFLHKNGLYVLLAYYTILFSLGGVFAIAFFGLIPQMLTGLFSFLCNWFAHKNGYRTYETKDDSRNNWWLSILTWGDSWHNNHHAKPWLYSFRHKWWEFDISGSIIHLIKDSKETSCT